jgi:hypothetical protein
MAAETKEKGNTKKEKKPRKHKIALSEKSGF